jgi:hypothetical protein
MNKPALLLSALIAFPLATPSAFAQSTAAPQAEAVMGKPNCAPPELVNSLPMEKVNGGDVMSVTATIEGSPERLLVDIGRIPNQLWESEADKLHLANQRGGLFDFGGRYSERSARVERFNLGSMESGGFRIAIVPNPQTSPAPYDGILGNVMMRHYDIDLDFAHQKLNFFTPEQCQGAGVYWSPSTISAVPIVAYTGMEYADRSPIPRLGDTYVPVTLDGQVIIALLDTRADHTFINPDVADKLFGLKPDGMEPVTVNDGGTVIKAGTHVFKSLSFGGLTAGNVHVAVPLDVMSQSSKIFHASKTARDTFYLHELMPDMVIGMDLLKHSHLYVAFQSDRVYVSAAGDGPALAAATPAKTTWLNVYR